MLELLSSAYFLVQIQSILCQNLAFCGYDEEFFECVFDQKNSTRNRTNELHCCQLAVDSFYLTPNYLSTYLNYLQAHNCPQLSEECIDRGLAITPYTEYVYMRFCNASVLEATCHNTIENVIVRQSIKPFSLTSWKNMTLQVDFLSLKSEELMDPCIQIAMLEKEIIFGRGHNFYEIKIIVPFSGITWCGFNEQIIKTKSISPWTCIDERGQTNMVLLIVFKVILAVVIVICNVTILAVFFTKKKMRNVPAIFRMSLAFADLLVGIVVFPSTAANLDHYFRRALTIDESLKKKDYPGNNKTNFSEALFEGIFKLCEPDSYSSPLVNAVGFFTTLSITVSVFTLVAAAVDRFVVVYRPLQRFKNTSFLVPTTSNACIWFLGVLIASIPFFFGGSPYTAMFSVVIVPSGFFATALYGILTLTALDIMWVITLATYFVHRNYLKKNAHLRSSTQDKTRALQSKNLIITLGVMVIAFTISVLPTSIFVIYDANFSPKNEPANNDIGVVVAILFLLNSLWNFFIYSVGDPAFRAASKNVYAQLFSKCRPRQ